MAVDILAIATALPEHSVSQERAITHASELVCSSQRQERVLMELYRRTEIKSRSSILAGEAFCQDAKPFFTVDAFPGPGTRERMTRYMLEAPLLAARAVEEALRVAAILPQQVTHLITVSCTGFFAPGVDAALIERLGISRSVNRINIGFMGCHGAINALKTANDIARGDSNSCILICAVEICTLHFQYAWNSNNMLANSLFSDGAGAAVVVPDSGASAMYGGSYIIPQSGDAMTWNVGNTGFEMVLSPRVPELITQNLEPWLSSWLQRIDLRIEDVKGWAVHPGGPRILDAVQSSLSLPDRSLEASRAVLSNYGNMSSPSVFFVFNELCKQEIHFPCLFLAFGPGLAVEALLWCK
jgi:predicted naringenin-chalcone synthase